jgi:hypothetical protein
MTWYAVVDNATGALLSVGSVIADPLPEGLVALELGEERPTGVWNPATRVHETPAPVRQIVLSRLEFLQRLTVQERIAIRTAAKSNPIVEDFMHLLDLAADVNLTHAATMQGVGYLEQQGLIAAGRAAAILA